MWLEWFKALGEVLANLAWPAVAVAFGLLYREPISRLIAHGKIRARAGELEYESLGSEVEIQNEAAAMADAANALAGAPENPNALMRKYEQELEALVEDSQKTTKLPRDTLLMRGLAEAYIMLTFERTYQVAFGSQLALIKRLQELGGQSDLGILSHYFENAKANFPDLYKTDTLQRWTDFLVTQRMIEVDHQRVRLTLEGQEFYPYLARRGYSLDKQG